MVTRCGTKSRKLEKGEKVGELTKSRKFRGGEFRSPLSGNGRKFLSGKRQEVRKRIKYLEISKRKK
jgi:hypothetical protein